MRFTANGQSNLMPQWSPPRAAGRCPVGVPGAIPQLLVAIEPATEWRDDRPGPVGLLRLPIAAMEPAAQQRVHSLPG